MADYIVKFTAEYLVNLKRLGERQATRVGSWRWGQGKLWGISGQM